MFAGIDELLGQQVAEPTGRLDGLGPSLERLGPTGQPLGLSAVARTVTVPSASSSFATATASVGRLVRIDTDDDGHEYLLVRQLGTARALLIPIVVHVPLSSHWAARTWWGALRSKAIRHQPPAGTSGVTPPGPLNATDRPQRLPSVSIRHFGRVDKRGVSS